MSAVEHNRAL